MNIEVGKFYKTRSGFKAKIYDCCAGGTYPIHGAVYFPELNDSWKPASWKIDGKNYEDSEHPCDIVSEWSEPKKKLLAFWSKKYGTLMLAEEDSPLHYDFKACGYRRLPNLDQEQT